MYKLTVLQFLYDLSDRLIEEAARDRISFRWFRRIDPFEEPPDYTAFCRFRELIGPEKFKRVLNEIVRQARDAGRVGGIFLEKYFDATLDVIVRPAREA